MGLLIVGLGALLLGLLVILLLSVVAPRPAGPVDPATGMAEAPHAWIARLDAGGLARLLEMLLAELKLEVRDSRVSAAGVDLWVFNPTPITGGRTYVRALARPPQGVVGEEEIRLVLETARAELAGKALVATGGVFSSAARAAAEGAPIELLDGPALLRLLERHLPPVAAARRV